MGDGISASGSASRFSLSARRAAKRHLVQERDSVWERFPDLPGSHFCFRKEAKGRYKIEARDGSLLATVEDRSRAGRPVAGFMGGQAASLPLTGPPRLPQGPLSVVFGEDIFDVSQVTGLSRWDWYQKGSARQPHMEAVDRATGEKVLWLTGRHLDRKPNAVVHLSETQWLQLPVAATSLRNAVMSAVDQSGSAILHFRWIVTHRPRVIGMLKSQIEVVVAPAHPMTPELTLIIALASGSLRNYFKASTGG